MDKVCGCSIVKGEALGTLQRGYGAGMSVKTPDRIQFCQKHAAADEMFSKLKQAYYTLRYMRGQAGLLADSLIETINKVENGVTNES